MKAPKIIEEVPINLSAEFPAAVYKYASIRVRNNNMHRHSLHLSPWKEHTEVITGIALELASLPTLKVYKVTDPNDKNPVSHVVTIHRLFEETIDLTSEWNEKMLAEIIANVLCVTTVCYELSDRRTATLHMNDLSPEMLDLKIKSLLLARRYKQRNDNPVSIDAILNPYISGLNISRPRGLPFNPSTGDTTEWIDCRNNAEVEVLTRFQNDAGKVGGEPMGEVVCLRRYFRSLTLEELADFFLSISLKHDK